MAKLTASIALASVLALGLTGGKVTAQGQPTGQMCGPISELSTLHRVGPRVEEPAISLSTQLYFAAPHEDIRLKWP